MNYALIYSYFLFSIIGIGNCIIKRKNPFFVFILVLLVGFLFSLPISPAYQTQYMRYYAASTSFLGILPAVGFSIIFNVVAKKIKLTKFLQPPDHDEISDLNIIFTIILTTIVLAGPLLIKAVAPKRELISHGCLEGESEVILNYYPGSSVSIISFGSTWVPNISEHDYKKGIHNIPDKETIDYFDNISIPNSIFPTINLLNDKDLYLVMGIDQLPQEKTTLHACGNIEGIASGDFFYPSRIEEYK